MLYWPVSPMGFPNRPQYMPPQGADPPQAGQPGTLVYTGIATIRGATGFRMPVYESPSAEGAAIGYLVVGGYVPHFIATDDHAWLQVTLHNGNQGWMRNDPAHVTVWMPEPAKVRVCIDPGHGGPEDTGAAASGLVEKDVNFDIAYWKLRPLLLADKRIDRVWYTRNGDYDASLRYRWDLANASGPALFLSVHQNGNPDPNMRGTETYYKCGTEGTPSIDAMSKRAGCLTQLALRDQINGWGSPTCPWVDQGVSCRLVSETDRRSYYYVLQNTNFPAILAECLYLTNPGDAACLKSDRFRQFLAEGLYKGITDTLFTTAPGDTCSFRTLYGL